MSNPYGHTGGDPGAPTLPHTLPTPPLTLSQKLLQWSSPEPSMPKPENFEQLCDLVKDEKNFRPNIAIATLCFTIEKLIKKVDSLEELLQQQKNDLEKMNKIDPEIKNLEHTVTTMKNDQHRLIKI